MIMHDANNDNNDNNDSNNNSTKTLISYDDNADDNDNINNNTILSCAKREKRFSSLEEKK